MDLIPGIIGAVTGILSILGVIYTLGVWKGRFETRLMNLQKALDDHRQKRGWQVTTPTWCGRKG